jgi:hypothetical protein
MGYGRSDAGMTGGKLFVHDYGTKSGQYVKCNYGGGIAVSAIRKAHFFEYFMYIRYIPKEDLIIN